MTRNPVVSQFKEDNGMKRAAIGVIATLFVTGLVGAAALRADDDWRGYGHMHGYGWHMGPGYGHMGPGFGHMGPGFGRMGPGHRDIGPRGPMRGFAFRGGPIDTNDNGVISDGEAARHFEGRFIFLDADSDGSLTKDEYLRFRPPFWMADRETMEKLEKRYEARLEEMDSDKDGKVAKSEYMAFHRKQFAAADSNEDGKVDVWEYRSQHRRYSRSD